VYKTTLADLKKGVWSKQTSLFGLYSDKISFNEGKAVYISEHGIYQLSMKCQIPIGPLKKRRSAKIPRKI
jgi:prophage antirepressor-like protein